MIMFLLLMIRFLSLNFVDINIHYLNQQKTYVKHPFAIQPIDHHIFLFFLF
jgi:hypothetical protein